MLLEVDFEERTGGDDSEVRSLLPQVSQKLDRSRRILNLVDEQECGRLPRICVLQEEYRLERAAHGKILIEDLAVRALFQIEGHALAKGPPECENRRGFADLPGSADDERFPLRFATPSVQKLRD